MRATKMRTEERREQIARAALDAIAEGGMEALSITEVARRVGIVPSAVYRHFEGKDAVLDAVLDLIDARLHAMVAAARGAAEDAPAQLRALLLRHAAMLAENRALPSVLLSDEMAGGHPGRRERVRDIMTDYLAAVSGIIREGKRQGAIDKSVSPRAAALSFLGLLLPAAVLHNVSDGGINLVRHAKAAWPAYARGLAPTT